MVFTKAVSTLSLFMAASSISFMVIGHVTQPSAVDVTKYVYHAETKRIEFNRTVNIEKFPATIINRLFLAGGGPLVQGCESVLSVSLDPDESRKKVFSVQRLLGEDCAPAPGLSYEVVTTIYPDDRDIKSMSFYSEPFTMGAD